MQPQIRNITNSHVLACSIHTHIYINTIVYSRTEQSFHERMSRGPEARRDFETHQTELEALTEMLSDVVARHRLRASSSQIKRAITAARSKRIEFEGFMYMRAVRQSRLADEREASNRVHATQGRGGSALRPSVNRTQTQTQSAAHRIERRTGSGQLRFMRTREGMGSSVDPEQDFDRGSIEGSANFMQTFDSERSGLSYPYLFASLARYDEMLNDSDLQDQQLFAFLEIQERERDRLLRSQTQISRSANSNADANADVDPTVGLSLAIRGQLAQRYRSIRREAGGGTTRSNPASNARKVLQSLQDSWSDSDAPSDVALRGQKHRDLSRRFASTSGSDSNSDSSGTEDNSTPRIRVVGNLANICPPAISPPMLVAASSTTESSAKTSMQMTTNSRFDIAGNGSSSINSNASNSSSSSSSDSSISNISTTAVCHKSGPPGTVNSASPLVLMRRADLDKPTSTQRPSAQTSIASEAEEQTTTEKANKLFSEALSEAPVSADSARSAPASPLGMMNKGRGKSRAAPKGFLAATEQSAGAVSAVSSRSRTGSSRRVSHRYHPTLT